MTEQARFGDFLHAAHHALAPQPGGPSPARGDVEEVSRSLQRVVTILGHYLQDTAIAFTDVPRHMPAPGGPWGRARAQARQALTKAAGFLLRPGTGRPMWPPAPSVSPLARRLDEVTVALATSRDLLHTHFTPGPQGGRAHRSPWALAITSEPVNRSLLAEIAALARPIARHSANVALAPVPGPPSHSEHRRALGTASDWLLVLAGSIDAASRHQPVPAADRELLAAIPVYAMPARPSLTAAETVSGLYDGVTATAERLRHLAWQTTGQPPWSAVGAPSRALVGARAASLSANPARDTTAQTTPTGQQQAPDMPGPLQHTLLRLGITSPALLDRGADLDRASQRLLIEAADQLPPGHQHPRASMLHRSAASAALLNYALATTDGRAARLLRQPSPPESKDQEPELEPET